MITDCHRDCEITSCYNFARNKKRILQKCIISFLNYPCFADDDCGWTIENKRFATTDKRFAAMSKLLFQ